MHLKTMNCQTYVCSWGYCEWLKCWCKITPIRVGSGITYASVTDAQTIEDILWWVSTQFPMTPFLLQPVLCSLFMVSCYNKCTILSTFGGTRIENMKLVDVRNVSTKVCTELQLDFVCLSGSLAHLTRLLCTFSYMGWFPEPGAILPSALPQRWAVWDGCTTVRKIH